MICLILTKESHALVQQQNIITVFYTIIDTMAVLFSFCPLSGTLDSGVGLAEIEFMRNCW